MTSLEELQERVVGLWGNREMTLEHAVSVLAVITGDVARHARDLTEGSLTTGDALTKELGNYILTTLRMCHIFGIPIDDAIDAAFVAQTNYLGRRP